MKEIMFSAKNIVKKFGATVALGGVDIQIRRGEIHGLIGENGSGKSTLSSIAAGVHKADSGTMTLDGAMFGPVGTHDANAAGISMVVQEQGVIPQLSVAANLFLGHEKAFVKNGLINTGVMHKEAAKALENVGITHIKPNDMVSSLTLEDRKLLEIARAVYTTPKLFIIDETTTALTVKGRDVLYESAKKLRSMGHSVLFISHDIEEIMMMCDSITILKDGKNSAELEKSEFDSQKIKVLMVGREIGDNYYRADMDGSYDEEVVLSANGIVTQMLRDVSLDLHKGEILGIGGLTDSGMRELGKVLFGLVRPVSGRVKTKNSIIKNPQEAIAQGIGYISKDRDKESLMLICSIRDNICLPSFRTLSKGGLIPRKAEKSFVENATRILNVKMQNMEQFVSELSGGNKQKVALAKWLGRDSDILILDCPTRGIDIGVKEAIYRLLYELKCAGKAIVMISEELPELIGMSDRVLTIKDGKVTGEYRREEQMTEDRLISRMI